MVGLTGLDISSVRHQRKIVTSLAAGVWLTGSSNDFVDNGSLRRHNALRAASHQDIAKLLQPTRHRFHPTNSLAERLGDRGRLGPGSQGQRGRVFSQAQKFDLDIRHRRRLEPIRSPDTAMAR